MELKREVPGDPSHEKAFESAESLTPVRMRTLCAVVETSSYERAATELGISEGAVSQHIRDLEKIVFGSPLIVRKSKSSSLQITDLGRSTAREFRQILETQWAMVIGKQPTSIRYLPHHSLWVLPAVHKLERDDGLPIKTSVLGEHHRALDHFVDRALRPIAAGLLDVAVGLDFQGSDEYQSVTEKLTATKLYTAWLEALVPQDDSCESINVTDLLTHHRLLTAPPGTRSRAYLESVVGAQNHGESLNVHLEEYESKVLVIGTYSGLGTTVLPSDVAIQFDARWKDAPLAGNPAHNYRWVPVVDKDHIKLEYDVVAYRRRASTDQAGAILMIKSLQEEARRVMEAAERPAAMAFLSAT